MYESLTALIPVLKKDNFVEPIVDKENDGTPEPPILFPIYNYSGAVRGLVDEIYAFERKHPDFGLSRYSDILNENGIEWGSESMHKADVRNLDGRAVMALLLGTVRAERFCDGVLLDFCKSGIVAKWLERLKEIDAE